MRPAYGQQSCSYTMYLFAIAEQPKKPIKNYGKAQLFTSCTLKFIMIWSSLTVWAMPKFEFL